MPSTFVAWAMFAFFFIGAVGGWIVIAVLLNDKLRRR